MGLLKIFAGRSNEPLAQAIDQCLIGTHGEAIKYPTVLGKLDERRQFDDGELYVRFGENIRGADVFIVQSTNQPDTHIWELLVMVHTARLASAGRITAVIPYLGYARQDWKDKSRAPISISAFAVALHSVGVDRVVLLDAHSHVAQGVFSARNIPCDHLWARPIFLQYLRSLPDIWKSGQGFVLVAPDINAAKLARKYAESLGNVPLVIVEKRRPKPGETEVLNIAGNVAEKDVLMVDDLIDSARTMCNAAEALKNLGAGRIFALATHGVFCADASARIANSYLEQIWVTNSIAQRRALSPKINFVSIAGLLAEAIWRIHTDQSVSSLFE